MSWERVWEVGVGIGVGYVGWYGRFKEVIVLYIYEYLSFKWRKTIW